MPFDSLPTFNSEAIETCIANIPNLSEHFLYANDDCFVYSSISPDYFFDKSGNPIIRLVKQPISNERIEKELYAQNVIYCCNLIKEKYGKKYFHELTHNINSYRKSYFLECKETFKEEFKRTCYNKFRSSYSVQQILINIYMIVKKHCKFRKIYTWDRYSRENLYIQLSNSVNMNEKIQKYKEDLKLFCINDDEKSSPEDRKKLENYLSFLFPDKQEWELF